jgi:hypothetical protein
MTGTLNFIKGWEELVLLKVLTNMLRNKLSFNSMIFNKTFPNSLTKLGLMPSRVVKNHIIPRDPYRLEGHTLEEGLEKAKYL